jgi:hypothetical protein
MVESSGSYIRLMHNYLEANRGDANGRSHLHSLLARPDMSSTVRSKGSETRDAQVAILLS